MAHVDRALRSNLKLRHLRLLVVLDQLRHVGKVAEHLNVTQPAVSKALAEIEQTLGLRLFDRSARGTVPTPYGQSVVRFARSVLAGFERTQDELASMASGAKGRTSVGAMVVAIPVLLARAVTLLKERSAHTTVLVDEGDLAGLMPRLRVGELDFIVGRLEPAHAGADVQMERLHDEPMVLVVRPDHPLGRKRKLDWADLAPQPWVLPPPWASSRRKLEQTFVRHRLEPPADIVEAVSFLAIISLVRERAAVGFLAQAVARQFEREGLVRILPIAFRQPIPPVGLIWVRGRRMPPSAELLMDCLRGVARRMR